MSHLATLVRTVICLGILLLPSTLSADKGQKKDGSAFLQPSDPALYSGAEACKKCHKEEVAAYERGPHWRTENEKHKGPQWQGCEACHGPGKAHVDTDGDPTKILRLDSLNAKQSSQRCLACHETNEKHSGFLRSAHLANGVGCTSCHSIHASQGGHNLLVKAQPSLCYQCHRDVEPDFSKPSHHRVNEGLMSCSDCHNPHGSALSHNLNASTSQGQVCTTCHVDTAGPFVFEHAPLKEQGCVACHSPHGSTNPHMLSRPTVNQICLECHSTILAKSIAPAVPTFHNQAQKYQQCILCHTAVHGSNTDPTLFKR